MKTISIYGSIDLGKGKHADADTLELLRSLRDRGFKILEESSLEPVKNVVRPAKKKKKGHYADEVPTKERVAAILDE